MRIWQTVCHCDGAADAGKIGIGGHRRDPLVGDAMTLALIVVRVRSCSDAIFLQATPRTEATGMADRDAAIACGKEKARLR